MGCSQDAVAVVALLETSLPASCVPCSVIPQPPLALVSLISLIPLTAQSSFVLDHEMLPGGWLVPWHRSGGVTL
ncbi:unnamed protein product [Arctogadus glacialis]